MLEIVFRPVIYHCPDLVKGEQWCRNWGGAEYLLLPPNYCCTNAIEMSGSSGKGLKIKVLTNHLLELPGAPPPGHHNYIVNIDFSTSGCP